MAARADSSQALAAWSAALPLVDNLPDAAAAAAAAETRLRELHPDAMGRYDQLRDTHTPTAALDEVGPLIDPTLSATSRAPRTDVDEPAVTAAQDPQAGQPPEERYAPVVREVLQAELAEQVLHDQAWPALAGALGAAEQLGARPADLLAAAAGERELASARSVAEVLTFRVEQHQVPSKAGPPRTPTGPRCTSATPARTRLRPPRCSDRLTAAGPARLRGRPRPPPRHGATRSRSKR